MALDDGGGSSVVATSSPAQSPPPSSSSAERRALAARVALSPADWGSGFKEDSPYEVKDAVAWVVDESCQWDTYALPIETVVLTRYVTNSVYADSTAYVYDNVRSAQQHMARQRDGTNRCPKLEAAGEADKTVWGDVREVSAATPSGADEMVAEQGRTIRDDKGAKADDPYTLIVARKGSVLVEVNVGGYSLEQALSALTLMVSRL